MDVASRPGRGQLLYRLCSKQEISDENEKAVGRAEEPGKSPTPLGLQPTVHHSRAGLRPYLPALPDVQECVRLALMGAVGAHREWAQSALPD